MTLAAMPCAVTSSATMERAEGMSGPVTRCPWHGKSSETEALDRRWDMVEDAGALTGKTEPSSLTETARVAWRNSARCIGRLHWQSLEVLDATAAADADAVAAALSRHLELALGGGSIRPLLTAFRSWDNPADEIRIWNHQLYGYAWHGRMGGRAMGDPRNAALTEVARRLGWAPPTEAGPHDLLPWVIQCGGRLHLREIPIPLRIEVHIRHPEHPALAALGLRWYPVPVLADMILATGGKPLGCAPFNGWYMGTEVGRDFADANRYDILPALATALGWDTSRERSLWKDRALLVLNEAILHSYAEDGWTLVDHHAASREFLRFEAREAVEGRQVSGDWAWLVPPLSGSLSPLFQRNYETRVELPNFLYQREAWQTPRGAALLAAAGA